MPLTCTLKNSQSYKFYVTCILQQHFWKRENNDLLFPLNPATSLFSFKEYLLSAHHVPGPVLGAGNSREQNKAPVLMLLKFYVMVAI